MENPYGTVSFGIENTPYGMICWALFLLDSYHKLKDKNTNLFFFDLIFFVSKKENYDFVQKWLDILRQQKELNLYLQSGANLHR